MPQITSVLKMIPFFNQSQLFVLTAQASRGIRLHGSIRKLVICPTKIAGAKLRLQLPAAIKTRHPPKAGYNRSCHTAAVGVLLPLAEPSGHFPST